MGITLSLARVAPGIAHRGAIRVLHRCRMALMAIVILTLRTANWIVVRKPAVVLTALLGGAVVGAAGTWMFVYVRSLYD